MKFTNIDTSYLIHAVKSLCEHYLNRLVVLMPNGMQSTRIMKVSLFIIVFTQNMLNHKIYRIRLWSFKFNHFSFSSNFQKTFLNFHK